MKKVLVLGAGGFIGNHLVTRLKKEGYWVRGVDLKYPEYQKNSDADDFIITKSANFLPKGHGLIIIMIDGDNQFFLGNT